MDPVVHFEMPYEDRDRMASFYGQAFGWTANKLGAEMGSYVVMMTSEEDKKTGFPTMPGRINGGFFKRTKENQYPSVVIGVKDIYAAMKKIEAAGGKVLGGLKPGEPDNIPGVGLYVSCIDTEGNRVSVIQPIGPMIGQQK
jgi:predicted enzyme related to lactoylglutathione lyase